jgi:phenylpropionate dioxygenase-like ring-hydroxylating dioxygenase large terminal subunit
MPTLLAEELPEWYCRRCAHRGVSLWFDRIEECGIRCLHHGWKYNVKGECEDVPSEPEESLENERSAIDFETGRAFICKIYSTKVRDAHDWE